MELAVAAALDAGNGDGLSEAAGLVREEFGVDRVSVHAFNESTGLLRVVACSGETLLGIGTELPIEISTPMVVTAGGNVYRGDAFDTDGSFSRPGDHLVTEMGFRSVCAIPLVLGNRPLGTLALSSRSSNIAWDSVIDALGDVSGRITLALHAAGRTDRACILVCHQDGLIAEGIARVLEQTFGAKIEICTAPAEALSQVEGSTRRIDTVICDSFFAEGRVHSFLRELRSIGLSAPTLVLGAHDSPLGHHLAIRSGAAGYVQRREGPAGLVAAVRKLSAGQAVGFNGHSQSEDRTAEPAQHLTVQESKLLLLLERGLRFKQIALEMSISESTAKGYARNVFSKLNVHSRAEAVYEARRQGVLELLHTGAWSAPVESAEQHN